MLKYRYDKEGLHKFIDNNQAYFSSVDYDTYNVITTLLNTEKIFQYDTEIKKEGNDMCKALDDLYNDGIDIFAISRSNSSDNSEMRSNVK